MPTNPHAATSRLLRDDLTIAEKTLSTREARFLVDTYYQIQDDRKRSALRAKSMPDEPHAFIDWLTTQSVSMETTIRKALDVYTDSVPIGLWAKSVHGIGPVITAGLISSIDMALAPSVGHIWRIAGLDPTCLWLPGTKRPWNARLKTICWHAGQSFMKFSSNEKCTYGHLYLVRKAYEIRRNESGGNAETAKALQSKVKATHSAKFLASGLLPPAHIDARARRWTVKIFLSHLHLVWHYLNTNLLPTKPYAIGALDHQDMIYPPNPPPGLIDALNILYGRGSVAYHY